MPATRPSKWRKPIPPIVPNLRSIDRRKQYVRFRVYPDSFATYLAARKVASSMGIAAGWVPYHQNFVHRESLGLPGNVYMCRLRAPAPLRQSRKRSPNLLPRRASPLPTPPPGAQGRHRLADRQSNNLRVARFPTGARIPQGFVRIERDVPSKPGCGRISSRKTRESIGNRGF